MIRSCLRDGCREPLDDDLVCPRGHRAEDVGWIVEDEGKIVAIVSFKHSDEQIAWAPGYEDPETPLSGRDPRTACVPRRRDKRGHLIPLSDRPKYRRLDEVDVQELPVHIPSTRWTEIQWAS